MDGVMDRRMERDIWSDRRGVATRRKEIVDGGYIDRKSGSSDIVVIFPHPLASSQRSDERQRTSWRQCNTSGSEKKGSKD
jgi:hypothetical protein